MDTIPNSLESVEAFAKHHGISFSFGTTPETASEASLNVFDRIERIDYFRDVAVSYHTPDAGLSSRTPYPIVTIWGKDGWTDRTYASTMHEFGHIHATQFPIGTRDGSRLALAEEVFAWNWARKHADVWTADMESRRVDALNSYGIDKDGHPR